MIDASLSEIDPLNTLAEEFLTRYRRGEQPDMGEYLVRYPDLAEGIRELFPALLLVEKFGPPTPEAPPPAEPMFLQQLGEYRLVREIGRGGMGIVYEAVQQSLGRRVAVKVLSPSFRHGKFLERFQREAKSAARLHHTNIVPVFGVGEHDGQPYYVMQFIDGRGLDAVLADMKAPHRSSTPPTAVASFVLNDDTSLTLASAFSRDPQESADPALPCGSRLNGGSDAASIRRMARLGMQAAEALAYAHAQGVLHRDIKPANLLLDTQGTLWIADFGLAKADDGDNLTEQGAVVGTLRYLAPERFQGQCGARADVYALGVTLYEMLTLRPAFGAVDRAHLVEQIARRAVTPPRRLVAAIPLDLETIVLKAMAHEPSDRYATAAALAEDLRRFLTDRPIRARRSSLVERLRRWRRRNPLVAWLSSTIVLLTLLLAAGSTLATVWLFRALSESESSQRDLREQLWRSLIEQARANRRSGRIGQRLESLRLLKEAADIRVTPEIRNEVIACLALIDSEEVAHWPRPKNLDAGHYDIDFMHGRYAQYDRAGAIRIRQLADDTEILHIDSRGELFPWGINFSPDGRYLTQQVQTNGRNLVWDVAGPSAKLVFDDFIGWSSFRLNRYSDDQRRLAVFRADGSVIAYDLAAGRRLKELPPGSTSGPFGWHPRHPWLAFAKEKDLRVVNVENDEELAHVVSPVSLERLAWHPDGERLAASGLDHTIFLWKPMAALPLLTFQGHKSFDISLSFHPSGQVLVCNDWDAQGRWWDVASGRQLLSAPGSFGRWLPGQPSVLSKSGNELRLHRLVEQRVLRSLACQKEWRRTRLHSARLDAAKRWAMIVTPGDLALFDLAQPAASLAALLPGSYWPSGFDSRRALLIASRKDLARRSLIEDGDGRVRLGPAESLYQIAPARAGRTRRTAG